MPLLVPLVVLAVAVLILGWIVWTRADAKKQLAAAFAVGATVSGGGSFFIESPAGGGHGAAGWVCSPVAVDDNPPIDVSGCYEVSGVKVCSVGGPAPVPEDLVVPPCVVEAKPARSGK
jgi:hypothetical protein